MTDTAAAENRVTRVLLIDDDEIDVENVKRAFRKNRIASPLHVANDGIEALEALRSGELERTRLLVLLDLNMPRMGGIEFLEELRRDPTLQAIPVVVLTTSDSENERVEAYNLNVAGYILKPVTFDAFARVVATLNNYWTMSELP